MDQKDQRRESEEETNDGERSANPIPVFRQRFTRSIITWSEDVFFFACCWPTLFMPCKFTSVDGQSHLDIPAGFKRLKSREHAYTFTEWITYLMNCSDGRYAAHPTFKFAALNIKNRESCLGSTNYGVNQMPDEEPMRLEEVRGIIGDSDSGLAAARRMASKITSWSSSITGSAPYWWARKKDVDRLVQEKLFYDNQLPILFHTGSMAEYHWPDLHQLLYQALKSWGRDEEANVVKRAMDGDESANLHPILNRYPVILNQFFVLRTDAWFQLVLKEGLGIKDYWRRYEFAKSRGAIHFHSILWLKESSDIIHKLLNRVLDAESILQVSQYEQEVAPDIVESIARHILPMTAEHPAGRERSNPDVTCTTPYFTSRTSVALGEASHDVAKHMVIGEDVHSSRIGNVDRWPGHEGRLTKQLAMQEYPDTFPLRTKLYELDLEDLIRDKIHFVNRVGLHSCSSYCLRILTFKNAQGEVRIKFECKWDYGEQYDHRPTQTDGKPARQAPALIQKKRITHIEMARDHPRVVQGAPQPSRAWGGNMDVQVVMAMQDDIQDLTHHEMGIFEWIAQEKLNFESLTTEGKQLKKDLYRSRGYMNKNDLCQDLIDYICGYTCKCEVAASDCVNLFKRLTECDLDPSTSFRSLAHRLNMQLLKTRQIPASECVFLLQGLQLYKSSHSFYHVSLRVGERQLDVNNTDDLEQGVVVKKNQFDKYMAYNSVVENVPISFDQFLHSSDTKIPVFMHGTLRAPWPLTEEYSKSMLLLHKKGVVSHGDILKHGDLQFDTHLKSFEHMLEHFRGDVPLGVVHDIQRSFMKHMYGAHKNPSARAAENNEGAVPDTPPEYNREDLDGPDMEESES